MFAHWWFCYTPKKWVLDFNLPVCPVRETEVLIPIKLWVVYMAKLRMTTIHARTLWGFQVVPATVDLRKRIMHVYKST